MEKFRCHDVFESDKAGNDAEETHDDLILQKACNILKRASCGLYRNSTTVVEELKDLQIFTFQRMKEVTDIIYEQASHKPDKAELFAKICKSFSKMEITKLEEGVVKTINFQDILVACILGDIEQRVMYKAHLQYLVRDYKGSEDRKQDWLKCQNEKLNKYLTKTGNGSAIFIKELLGIYFFTSDSTFKIVEAIQDTPGHESAEYLCILLTVCGKQIQMFMQLRSQIDHREYFKKMFTFIHKNSLFPINENYKLKNLMRLEVNNWCDDIIDCKTKLTIDQKFNENINDDPDFYKDLQGILNLRQLLFNESKVMLSITSEKRLVGAANFIYETAVCKPNSTRRCAATIKDFSSIEIVNENEEKVIFRKIIITKCQEQFECKFADKWSEMINNSVDAENTITLQLTLEQERVKQIGNCRLIAELFNVVVIPIGVLCKIIESLLSELDDLSLVLLCVLLKTIDTWHLQRYITRPHIDLKYAKQFESYYKRITEIVESQGTSFKVKSILQGVLNEWIEMGLVKGTEKVDTTKVSKSTIATTRLDKKWM